MSISVQDTNLEALQSKIAAIKAGYFEDDFALSLIDSNVKKDVIMKRGYWARVQAIRSMIANFSKLKGKK